MRKGTCLIAGMTMLILLAISCKHMPEGGVIPNPPGGGGNPVGGTQPCSADTVYFQNKVLPLIISSCAKSGCHDAISQQDGIQLTSYQTIMNSGIVAAGNPNGSDMYEVITETDPTKIMPPPPSSPLTAAEKDLIFKWILQGARNNACNDCDTSSFTYSQAVLPITNTYCRGCHNPSFISGGLDVTTYASMRTIALNGKLMGVINHATGYSPMPKGAAKMSDCRITQIRKWIDAGAPNN